MSPLRPTASCARSVLNCAIRCRRRHGPARGYFPQNSENQPTLSLDRGLITLDFPPRLTFHIPPRDIECGKLPARIRSRYSASGSGPHTDGCGPAKCAANSSVISANAPAVPSRGFWYTRDCSRYAPWISGLCFSNLILRNEKTIPKRRKIDRSCASHIGLKASDDRSISSERASDDRSIEIGRLSEQAGERSERRSLRRLIEPSERAVKRNERAAIERASEGE